MSGDKLSDVVGDLILLVGTGYVCVWGDGSGGGVYRLGRVFNGQFSSRRWERRAWRLGVMGEMPIGVVWGIRG